MGFGSWCEEKAQAIGSGIKSGLHNAGEGLRAAGRELKADFNYAAGKVKDFAIEAGQDIKYGYNQASGFITQQRDRVMEEVEELSPGLARGIRAAERSFKVVEAGLQDGVVQIGSGFVWLGGDLVLNQGAKLITGEKLYEGSASNWTREHLNKGLNKLQEVGSLGLYKSLEQDDMSANEQKVSNIISLGTQFALPAAGVVGGIAKGGKLLSATRSARALNPAKGAIRTFFDDAAHFSQHPVSSVKSALQFGNSANSSVHLGAKMVDQGVQLAGNFGP